MKLIDNAKHWYKMFSMQANVINASFLGTWAMLPERFQDVLPTPALLGIAISLVVLGMIGRVVHQESVSK